MEACPDHVRGNWTTTKALSRQERKTKVIRDRLGASQMPKPKLEGAYEPQQKEVKI